MKKILSIVIIFSIGILLVYLVVKPNNQYDLSTSDNVVKSYFLALNSKDEKLISSITDEKTVKSFDNKNIKNINLISIEENPKSIENMKKYEKEKFDKYHDVKCYKVVYDIQLKVDNFDENGKNQKIVMVAKNDVNSNWIIREIDEG